MSVYSRYTNVRCGPSIRARASLVQCACSASAVLRPIFEVDRPALALERDHIPAPVFSHIVDLVGQPIDDPLRRRD